MESSILPNFEPLPKSIAPPKRTAVLFVKLHDLMVPFVAPTSNAIAPPLPVSHLLEYPYSGCLSSFQVLFAVPNAWLLSNEHKVKVTLWSSWKKIAPPRPAAIQFVNVTL